MTTTVKGVRNPLTRKRHRVVLNLQDPEETLGLSGHRVWVGASANGVQPDIGAYVNREDLLSAVAEELGVVIFDAGTTIATVTGRGIERTVVADVAGYYHDR